MNCNTQNAKIKSITEKTLIVGIDVVTVHGYDVPIYLLYIHNEKNL